MIVSKRIWLLSVISLLTGMLMGALIYAIAQRDAAAFLDQASNSVKPLPSTRPAMNNVSENETATIVSSVTEERWEFIEQTLLAQEVRLAVLEAQLTNKVDEPVENNTRATSQTTGEPSQHTLLAAGVDPGIAADYLNRQNHLDMQRLELRDQASREGWLRSERFVETLRELEANVGPLREEIGDDAYDRFLYLTGQPNRVMVASVIDASPAQQAGMQVGDMVLGYAQSRIFSHTDLQHATRAGERGEYVLIQVQRAGQTLELSLPRGPIGVRLDAEQIDPDNNG